jgi:hypothetical protein
MLAGVLFASGSILAGGCADEPQPVRTTAMDQTGVISARAMLDAPPEKLSNLLNFETTTDTVFVSTDPAGRTKADAANPHGGKSSLRIDAGTTQIKVKLASLLSGRQFPGDWTLVGGHFYSPKPVGVTVRLENENGTSLPAQPVRLEPNRWTDAMIDVTPLAGAGAGVVGPALAPTLIFKFDAPLAEAVWCDDVEMLDNTNLLAGEGAAPAAGAWSIHRRGHQYVGAAPGRFSFKLKLKGADPLGWECVEASNLRARFTSAGQPKELTLYADGRTFSDGKYSSMVSKELMEPDIGQQHLSPAEVSVPADQGKVDRGTPGDSNNDGYNECRGAYQLVAAGQRMEATLTPRSAQLVRPVLEVAKFPPGKVLATLEGRLVDKTTRLQNGNLLVELPGRITRPTTLSLRVQ